MFFEGSERGPWHKMGVECENRKCFSLWNQRYFWNVRDVRWFRLQVIYKPILPSFLTTYYLEWDRITTNVFLENFRLLWLISMFWWICNQWDKHSLEKMFSKISACLKVFTNLQYSRSTALRKIGFDGLWLIYEPLTLTGGIRHLNLEAFKVSESFLRFF